MSDPPNKERKMSAKDLKELLADVDDTRELVLPPVGPRPVLDWRVEELYLAWSAADEEEMGAYRAWRARPGREAYLVYRAAADRADAAQVALAEGAANARRA